MDEEIKNIELEAEDTFVNFGSELKDLGGGKFGGYLVRFGNKEDTDLEGEFFNKDTDFDLEFPAKSSVYFQHGMDPAMKRKVMGKADLKVDEFGVWAEVILAERDEYEKFIAELAKNGKLGWSSGTAGHLVERVRMGKSTWISRWPLGLDASLTHTPAEPRNEVVPLKSLEVSAPEVEEPQAGEAGEASSAALEAEEGDSEIVETISQEKEFEMDEDTKKEISEMISETVKAAIPAPVEEPAVKGAELVAPAVKKVTELGFKEDETKSFIHWMQTGDEVAYKAAMQGQTDSEGGFSVPDDFYAQIVEKKSLLSFIRQTSAVVIPTSLDKIRIPAEGTAATKFVVSAEEANYDENEPTLADSFIEVHKMTKLIKLSEELEADAKANLQGYFTNLFARSLAMAENYYFTVGTGTGMPLGILAGATASGITTATAAAITAAEIVSLVGTLGGGYFGPDCGFLMKNATKWYLKGLAGNPFSFIPTPSGGDFLGYPAYVSDDMEAVAATKKAVVFGNFSYYAIAEREGMSVTRNPYLYQLSGQIGLFAKVRLGGTVVQAEAFQSLLQHA